MELEEGKIYRIKELAEWKGITPGAFSNKRERHLKELEAYCNFEDLGRKGIRILDVKWPIFLGKAKTIVENDFMEAWQDNPN